MSDFKPPDVLAAQRGIPPQRGAAFAASSMLAEVAGARDGSCLRVDWGSST